LEASLAREVSGADAESSQQYNNIIQDGCVYLQVRSLALCSRLFRFVPRRPREFPPFPLLHDVRTMAMDKDPLYSNSLPLAKLKRLASEILMPPSDSLEVFGGLGTDCCPYPVGLPRYTTISLSESSELPAGCFPFAFEAPTRFALDSCLAKERSTLCNLTCFLFGARHRSLLSAA
jgi:hypothetical protein